MKPIYQRSFCIAATFLLIATSQTSLACEAPNLGAEYDALIKLSVVDEQARKYSLQVPLEMNDTPFLLARMTYWPKPKEPEQYSLAEEIFLGEIDGVYVGYFFAPDEDWFTEVEILVIYEFPESYRCGTYARAKIERGLD